MDDLFEPFAPHAPLPAEVYEPNETFATAQALTEGSHEIAGEGVDWFKVESQAGILDILMTPTAAPLSLNMVLYNSAGQAIRTAFTPSGAEHITYTAAQGGTYYIQITTAQFGENPPDGTALTYTLDIDLPQVVPDDGNDTRATAQSLAEGDHEILGTGVDWYRLDSLAGEISVTMTESQNLDEGDDPRDDPRNLNVVLYNSAGQAVKQAFSNGPVESFTYLANTAGAYYLKVSSAQYGDAPPDGLVLSYDLNIGLPEPVEEDGNDSPETATELTPGSRSVSGTGLDWYRFDSLSGLIGLTLTPTGAGGTAPSDLNMVLYDSNLAEVKQNFAAGAESLTYLAGAEGPWYVKIFAAAYGNGAPNGVSLDYTLALDLPEDDGTEAGDSHTTAVALDEGVHVRTGTGVDWYRLDTLSGTIAVTMTQSGSPAAGSGLTEPLNLNVELYDADGNVVRQDFSDGSSESFSYLAGADGVHYLKVYWAAFEEGAPNGVELSYTLDIDLPEADAPEANDSRGGATLLPGSGSYTRSGTGVDWYRFETGPGVMDFAMTPIASGGADPLNLNLELYRAGEDDPLRMSFTEGAESFSTTALASGTYDLKVYWAPFPEDAPNGTTLSYRLDLDLPVNSWSVPLDFGPVRNASVAAYDIDNDGKDEIFIGTSKALDEDGDEVRPAGLIVLEDDGTVKWTKSFPAVSFVDPATGKTYQTTSVTTAPTFSDVNGDGKIDIVVGTGADNRSEFGAVGQPGDLGALYAVDAEGNTLWSFATRDSFGDDGRPDGVYGAPRVFDIDADGVREVLFESWDHYLYVLDGRTGALEREVNLHDTAGATPGLADLNNDGLYEIVAPSDVTDNGDAGLPEQGGILHVLSNYGQHNVPGFDDQVANSTDVDFRGKFEDQSLWSSPQIVDLNRDGKVEIVQGTGNFFQDERGQYVKVWNADGTLRLNLATDGRVLAAPLIADLDGNGAPEILAATVSGHIHAWSANGTELFDTLVQPFNGTAPLSDELPIVRSPVAVDLDGDGDLEILVSIGSQMIALDSDGTQISSLTAPERVFSTYSGSPLVKDIDGDGRLDLISGGTTDSHDQAVIFRFESPVDVVSDSFRTAAYQDNQSLHQIRAFVERFYTTILGREADAGGGNIWTDLLQAGVRSGADVARGFVASKEFVNRGTDDTEFVSTLYAAFFGRAPDAGLAAWVDRLEDGLSRDDVLNGFIGSREFINLANSYGIRAAAGFGAASDAAVITGDATEPDVLRGGAGANTIYDEGSQVEETGLSEETLAGQVYRLYGATLGRSPDAAGFLAWFDGLNLGNITAEQAAAAFVGSKEFQKTYGALDDAGFIGLLYQNVLGRAASLAEVDAWEAQLDGGKARAEVVLGFADSREFQNRTNPALDSFMRKIQPAWTDVLEGGAGDDVMNAGTGSDVFVFRQGQGGTDTIHGFEPWDELQLSGFGYDSAADVLAKMTQQGANVRFEDAGQIITFLGTRLTDMGRVRYNLS